MAVYIVSFELKADDTYSRRYSSFMEQLKKTTPWWAENTSCVVVSTNENIDEFCTRIYFNSDILDTKDRFLVLDANAKVGRVRGPINDQDLFKLLPFVVKL